MSAEFILVVIAALCLCVYFGNVRPSQFGAGQPTLDDDAMAGIRGNGVYALINPYLNACAEANAGGGLIAPSSCLEEYVYCVGCDDDNVINERVDSASGAGQYDETTYTCSKPKKEGICTCDANAQRYFCSYVGAVYVGENCQHVIDDSFTQNP